jgi:hypothetical protein
MRKANDVFIERSALRGILRYTVFKKGVAVEKFEDDNLIVNGARFQMARLVAGNVTGRNIDRIAVGTSGDVPAITDTEIAAPFIKAVDGFDYPENGQVQIRWKLLTSEANGKEIREFGLLTADGMLFARRIRDKPIFKESDISIEGEWIIIF